MAFGRSKKKQSSAAASSNGAPSTPSKTTSATAPAASPAQKELHARAKAAIEAKQASQRQLDAPPPAKKKSLKTSWLARTAYFQRMSSWAFEVIDVDKSGHVDEKELYSGLLLIHLKLGTYAGPAACKPISLERCHEVFVKMDVDKSGSLDRAEFQQVMMVLFSNVLLRVVFQYAATIALVPILGQYMVNALGYIFFAISTTVVQVLREVGRRRGIELLVDPSAVLWDPLVEAVTRKLPGTVLEYYDIASEHFHTALSYVPDSIWETLPLTLASTILGILVVPWTLLKIDDFFQSVAEKKSKEVEET